MRSTALEVTLPRKLPAAVSTRPAPSPSAAIVATAMALSLSFALSADAHAHASKSLSRCITLLYAVIVKLFAAIAASRFAWLAAALAAVAMACAH